MNMNQPPPFVPIIQEGAEFINNTKERPHIGKVVYQYINRTWVSTEIDNIQLMDNVRLMVVHYNGDQAQAAIFLREFGIVASILTDKERPDMVAVHIMPVMVIKASDEVAELIKSGVLESLEEFKIPQEAVNNDAILKGILKQHESENELKIDFTTELPDIKVPEYDGEPID